MTTRKAARSLRRYVGRASRAALLQLHHQLGHDPRAITTEKLISLLATFDLLEINGAEVRKQPLIERKELLSDLLKKARDGIEYSHYLEGNAHAIFEHACKLGHEGIVVKRKDLPYESGLSKRWIKIKNPASPAAKRHDDGTF